MANRKNWLAMLVLAFVLAGCAGSGPTREEYQALQERLNQLERQQQSAPAQTNIQGAWEIRNGGNVWVISFIEGTFVIFRNGEMFQYGTYTLDPSAWGINPGANYPRSLYMEFGFERDRQGLHYDISSNELVLIDPSSSTDFRNPWRSISVSGYIREFPLGTYRRGSEPTEARNLLIGTWRQDFNQEGKDFTEIFRFLPNGKGVVIAFPHQYKLYDAGLLRVTYEWGAAPGTGQVSLWRVDTSTPNWESVVFNVSPFSIDGDVLRFEKWGEYRKR